MQGGGVWWRGRGEVGYCGGGVRSEEGYSVGDETRRGMEEEESEEGY